MGKYTFGPVPSRRLGFSLGVDIIPKKYCTFDCVYCQVGKTTCNTIERKSFFDPNSIVQEIIERSKAKRPIDFITFSGTGEPTLNSDIGWIIREVKRYVELPIALITNSSLLWNEKVRADIVEADVILPSFDAASEDIFCFINRPHGMISLDMLIEGIRLLRKDYRGKIWLEIMLIDGINDDEEELKKLKGIVKTFNPEKIQLNTVTRPPLDDSIIGVDSLRMDDIREFFGEGCEVIGDFDKDDLYAYDYESSNWQERILEMIGRRSLTIEDITKVSGLESKEVERCLKKMEREGKVKRRFLDDTIFFVVPDEV
ncbi:MAG: radical SAM protein [Syntrophorhabdaceae bacterium]|nr:radical SAM protein [Syntrophorhabdaceae bacterium]